MNHYRLLPFIFIFHFSSALAQVKLPSNGANLSKEQLWAFQEAAEKKKNQFIKCVERITRNEDVEIRKTNIDLGINLFVDTAHVQVSNVRTNSVHAWKIKDYFNTVVAGYYNPMKPVAISFQADPVIIDKFNRDEDGNIISIEGHFTFSQNFCRCQNKVSKPTEEMQEFNLCYCDKTNKTGNIMIKPMDSPTGITWLVLLSGIVVNETTEK
jgi:hypothetical protein